MEMLKTRTLKLVRESGADKLLRKGLHAKGVMRGSRGKDAMMSDASPHRRQLHEMEEGSEALLNLADGVGDLLNSQHLQTGAKQPLVMDRTDVPCWRGMFREADAASGSPPEKGLHRSAVEEGKRSDMAAGSAAPLGIGCDQASLHPDLQSQSDTNALLQVLRRHRLLAMACLVMVVLGVVVGMVFQNWSLVDALYVITQIVTTVGYGDVIVKSDSMQLFMAAYVLLSLLIIANLLNIVTNSIIEQNSKALRDRMARLEFLAGSVRDLDASGSAEGRSRVDNAIVATGYLLAFVTIGTVFFRFMEGCTCPDKNVNNLSNEDCQDEAYHTCIADGHLPLTWANSFYMSVVTMTTVGFGDFTPKSQASRLFAIFWMLGGVAATGNFIKAISEWMAGDGDETVLEDVGAMNEALFQAMDTDRNGFLTRSEYTRYILIKHGLVPKDIVDEIDAKFDFMDTSGSGQVTWEMVQEAAGRSRRAGDVSRAESAA